MQGRHQPVKYWWETLIDGQSEVFVANEKGDEFLGKETCETRNEIQGYVIGKSSDIEVER